MRVDAQDPAGDGRADLRGLEVRPGDFQAGLGLHDLGPGDLHIHRTDGLHRGQLGPGVIERVPRLLELQGLVVEVLARAGQLLEEQGRPAQVPLGGLVFVLVLLDERLCAWMSSSFEPAWAWASLARATSTSAWDCRTAATRRGYGSRIATTCPACTRSPTATINRSTRPPSAPLLGAARSPRSRGPGARRHRPRWAAHEAGEETSMTRRGPGLVSPPTPRVLPESGVAARASPGRAAAGRSECARRVVRIHHHGGRHDRITPWERKGQDLSQGEQLVEDRCEERIVR